MPQDDPGPRSGGAVRRGRTIESVDHGLRFDVPTAWCRWHEENDDHPNLHLTPDELEAVEETEGEWDREFARVVNALLPFDRCVAHVGGEGWGPHGISFADLQVRAYVLPATAPEEIERRVRSQGAAAVADVADDVHVTFDRADAWRRTVLSYRLFYGDYGATALVDLRLRRFGKVTVAFAFMYTDHSEHAEEIDAMLRSVTFAESSPT